MRKALFIASVMFISSVILGMPFDSEDKYRQNLKPIQNSNIFQAGNWHIDKINRSTKYDFTDFICDYETNEWHDDITSLTEYLRNLKDNLNEEDEGGYTSLIIAVKLGDKNVINGLIENGADINYVNRFGKTPLIIAIEKDNVDIVEYLIKLGADVNKTKRNGLSPLAIAIKMDSNSVISVLLENHAIVEGINLCTTDIFGNNLLHQAVLNNKKERVENLIKLGLDINQKNGSGKK